MEYRELSKLGIGFVANTITEWREKLAIALGDPYWRTHDAEFARKIDLDNYGLEATGRRYDDVLSSLL